MYGKSGTMATSGVENGIRIRILVVDDDSTCLSIIAAMLKTFDYQVATANNPLEALSMLRLDPEYFDIVLTDIHMPYMSGLELHKLVDEEYHIPVILMSCDDKRSIVLEGLGNGAAFFIIKPPTQNDFKNIWQFVVSRKKGKKIVQHENQGVAVISTSTRVDDDPRPTKSLYREERPSLDSSKRKFFEEENKEKGENINFVVNRKKPKLVWTTTLHNQFLEAVSVLGPHKAVPKRILEFMNIEGLTRENIASHLQKYRIYLRRVCETSGSIQNGMPQNWNQNPFRSGFSWSQFPTLANNSYLINYSNNNVTRPNNNINIPLVDFSNNYNQNPPIMNNNASNTGVNLPGYNNNNSQIVSNPRGTWVDPGANRSVYNEPTNFLAGEICILESSMVGPQSNIINNNIHNYESVINLGNQKLNSVAFNNVINNNNTAPESNFDGTSIILQTDNPVLGQNDPQQQEIPNLDVSTTGAPTHWQDWTTKNLDDFFLDGIDDLTAFLSNYDASNNQ